MKQQSVLIAGASGLIGTYLQKRFTDEGWAVHVLGRKETVSWDMPSSIVHALNTTDLLINLAGRTVNCRHTAENKKEILESRTQTTATLNECLRKCENPPRLWLNSSGNAIYPRSIERVFTESETEVDDTFMAKVCEAWEAELFANETPGTRRVAMRTSIVLSKEGGALKELMKVAKLGLGGAVASGEQMVSWIHLEDFFQTILKIESTETLEGPVNFSAPNPVSNKEFMQKLRKSLGVPFGIPTPKFALEIGSFFLGTEASLALDSYNVVSSKLAAVGFQYLFPTLDSAFKDFWSKRA